MMTTDMSNKIELSKDLYVCAESDIITFCVKEKEAEPWRVCFENGIAESAFEVEGAKELLEAAKVKLKINSTVIIYQ